MFWKKNNFKIKRNILETITEIDEMEKDDIGFKLVN